MRWDGGDKQWFSEAEARAFEAPGPAVIESRMSTITWTPWEDADQIVRLYWREGTKVHLLGRNAERFLCGVPNSERFMRVLRATDGERCRACMKHLSSL